MKVPERIDPGEYPVDVRQDLEGRITVYKPTGEVILSISPIGITKASHKESKKRRKMASTSRKRNRRK